MQLRLKIYYRTVRDKIKTAIQLPILTPAMRAENHLNKRIQPV